MKQKAIMMALSDKLAQSSLIVVENLEMKEFKTKDFNSMLKAFEKELLPVRRNLLIVNGGKSDKAFYSGRNLKGVDIINPENINIVDLLSHRQVMMTEEGIKALEKNYGKK